MSEQSPLRQPMRPEDPQRFARGRLGVIGTSARWVSHWLPKKRQRKPLGGHRRRFGSVAPCPFGRSERCFINQRDSQKGLNAIEKPGYVCDERIAHGRLP